MAATYMVLARAFDWPGRKPEKKIDAIMNTPVRKGKKYLRNSSTSLS
jgi:hypothetical protein